MFLRMVLRRFVGFAFSLSLCGFVLSYTAYCFSSFNSATGIMRELISKGVINDMQVYTVYQALRSHDATSGLPMGFDVLIQQFGGEMSGLTFLEFKEKLLSGFVYALYFRPLNYPPSLSDMLTDSGHLFSYNLTLAFLVTSVVLGFLLSSFAMGLEKLRIIGLALLSTAIAGATFFYVLMFAAREQIVGWGGKVALYLLDSFSSSAVLNFLVLGVVGGFLIILSSVIPRVVGRPRCSCGSSLKWIKPYGRWYCLKCKTYAPKSRSC